MERDSHLFTHSLILKHFLPPVSVRARLQKGPVGRQRTAPFVMRAMGAREGTEQSVEVGTVQSLGCLV